MVNPPNNQNHTYNNGEPPPAFAPGGSTVLVSAAELVPSTTNLMYVQSRAYSGPVLSYVGPQGQPVNPLGTQGPPVTPPPSRGNQFLGLM